jgi:hypothetical protein
MVVLCGRVDELKRRIKYLEGINLSLFRALEKAKKMKVKS